MIPSDRITLVNVFELLIEFVMGLSDSIIGQKGRKYLPLYGTFFIFILLSNFIGLVPGFSPPTSNLNITLGMGLISFGAYHYFGVREHGGGYIKQFMGPFLVIAPLFFLIEVFSHMFRPLTLGLRLAFNMFADHLVVGDIHRPHLRGDPGAVLPVGSPGLRDPGLRFHPVEHDLCVPGHEPRSLSARRHPERMMRRGGPKAAAPERRKQMKQLTAFVLTGLFVLILSGVAAAAEAAGGGSAGLVPGIVALGAGLGIAIAAFGCALAQGRVGGAAMESIGRNPNSADKIFTPLILSLALIEALGIYALIIAFILAGKV